MGENSKIEWTDHTFNPWWGCVKVSPGCQHCYAETLAHRFGRDMWGVNKPRRLFGEKHWREPLKWNEEARAAGVRKRVFCASMADVFEDRRDLDPEREKLWRLVEETTWLDWLLLTKRPEHIEALLPGRWHLSENGLPPNVWFGISAEDQARFDERWPVLESFAYFWYPARLFISAEPLLGPIDIAPAYAGVALDEHDCGDEEAPYFPRPVDWVIVGGESGPQARSMHPDWARSIRDQCVEAGVAFHFKQWGEWATLTTTPPGRWGNLLNGDRPDRSDTSERRFRVGKQRAGRLLDGRTWDEFPDA